MTKGEARLLARARLAQLSGEERERAGERIARAVWSLPELAAARTLLLYSAVPGEVPTDKIAAEAWSRGLTVLYPRCVDDFEMTLHQTAAAADLRAAGRYGILEPDESCPMVAREDVDVVLVPGLAWDAEGNRLGRGRGYFDRLLGDRVWRGFRCGLFFAVQELPRVPSDRFDVRLDAVVTEERLVRFG